MRLGLDAMPGLQQLLCHLPWVKLTKQRNGRGGDSRGHCTAASTKWGPSFLTSGLPFVWDIKFSYGLCLFEKKKKGLFITLLLY